MSRFALSSPKIVAEVIDGEAIILDLRAGTYFATQGVGAAAWAAAVAGWSSEEILSSADSFYRDATGYRGSDVTALFDELLGADLLVATDAVAGDAAAPTTPIDWPATWAAPALEKHSDLQDMMQLDPIHDTDASGWPMPAPDSPR